jgi:hypothetical protein
MKTKKIKKLAKFIFNEVEGMNRKKRYESDAIPMKENVSQSNCEYDKEVSDKFFNFVCNLMKLKTYLSIDIYDEHISINGDLDRVKYSNSISKYNSEDIIEIKIDKTGFRVRRSYGNYLNYLDSEMLEKLKPMLVEKNKIVSKEMIIDIIDDIMVKTNLSRENNLDELLKDKN